MAGRTKLWVIVLLICAGGVLVFLRVGRSSKKPSSNDIADSSAVKAVPEVVEQMARPPSSISPNKTQLHPAPASIPESLQPLFGEKDESYMQRSMALKNLPDQLSGEEINALIYLLYQSAGQVGLSPDELNALKNDVMNELKRRMADMETLAQHLVWLYEDTAQDAVLRDYCIQHLGTLYRKLEGDNKAKVLSVLWMATDDRTSPTAGTALIALADNREYASVSVGELSDKAVAIAGNPGYAVGARVTAVQIGAKLSNPQILPVARKLAGDRSEPVPLRVSAIAAIGMMGDSSDRALLDELASSSDSRLQTAARSAVGRARDQ